MQDSASVHTHESGSSIISATAAKASKLKMRVKSKLHRHRDGEDGGDDDADEYEEDDGVPVEEVTVTDNGSVRQTQYNETSERPLTPAQTVAMSYSQDDLAGSSAPPGQGKAVPVAVAAVPTSSQQQQPHGRAGSISAHSVHGARSPGAASDSASITSNHPAAESDWKRKAEFHNLFEEIDNEEVLVSDYTSAWAKDILRHGRLYVGAQHLAFICTVIGLKTHCVLPYADITLIEKANTARVIPNAINVTIQSGEQYLFSSFVGRDRSYDLIVDCWKAENPGGYEKMVSTQVDKVEDALEHGTAESPFPNETSAEATPATAHPATECSGNHFKETVLDVRFPSEPEKIFNLVYHDDGFMQALMAAQKLTDPKIGEWQGSKRTYSYVKPLSGSVGPSQTTCHIEDESLAEDAEKAYEVQTITKTPDVPSGGSFQVQTKTCITWAGGAKGGCRMLATTDVVWSGRSMIKGIVTSASIAGQRDYNKELAKAIRAHIKSHPAEFGSSDVSAPEADDELAEDAEKAVDGTSSAGATAGGSGLEFLGGLAGPLQAGGAATAVLALANVALLLILLVSWLRGPSAVKVNKVVMTGVQEAAALQRLETLEAAWSGFRQCVDRLVEDAK